MRKEHEHTAAMRMAQADMDEVIRSFSDGPKFMEDEKSMRTMARQKAIDSAPPDVKALLDQGFSQEFVERLARLRKGG